MTTCLRSNIMHQNSEGTEVNSCLNETSYSLTQGATRSKLERCWSSFDPESRCESLWGTNSGNSCVLCQEYGRYNVASILHVLMFSKGNHFMKNLDDADIKASYEKLISLDCLYEVLNSLRTLKGFSCTRGQTIKPGHALRG